MRAERTWWRALLPQDFTAPRIGVKNMPVFCLFVFLRVYNTVSFHDLIVFKKEKNKHLKSESIVQVKLDLRVGNRSFHYP